MNGIRTRGILAAGAAGLLLMGAGTAVAATRAGAPASAPRYGLQHRGMGNGGMGYGVMAGGVVMDAAAGYLGLSESALAAQRHDGKSLAQIAVAQGKTVEGLQQALVTAFKANLDQAVAAGRLTESQAAQALEHFQSQVQALVTRTETGPMSGTARGTGTCPGSGAGPRWSVS